MSLFLDLLFPRTCYGCGRIGSYLCPACRHQLHYRAVTPPPSSSRLDGRLSLFAYKPPLRDLLLALKFDFVTDLVNDLADLAVAEIVSGFPHLLSYWQQHQFCLLPLPLHPYRQNWRGFNQSRLLADRLAPRLSLDCQPDLLLHPRPSAPQTSLADKSRRLANVKNVFSLNPGHFLPANCLLFDDVATTGATLESAATTLRQSGVSSVWALTIAS